MEQTMLYRFYDKDGVLLYVGITSVGPSRWSEHRRNRPWWHEVQSSKIEHFPTRQDALLAESLAIRIESPRYNKRGTSIQESLSPQTIPHVKWDIRKARELSVDWRTVVGPTVEPLEWRELVLKSFDFKSTIYAEDSYGHTMVSASRYVHGPWVELQLDYCYHPLNTPSQRYAGCDMEGVQQVMSMLKAEFYGSDLITWGPFRPGSSIPSMWFPKILNDWFVRTILSADSGDFAMYEVTEDVVRKCAPHLPDSWDVGAIRINKRDRKALCKQALHDIATELHDVSVSKVSV
jgi:hypothetical protein